MDLQNSKHPCKYSIPMELQSKASLAALTAEIMDRICMVQNMVMHHNRDTPTAEYIVSKHDIIALRLTTRQLRLSTIYAFGMRNFTVRNHIFTPYSLEALIQISTHPEFSSFVREVAMGPETATLLMRKNAWDFARFHEGHTTAMTGRGFTAMESKKQQEISENDSDKERHILDLEEDALSAITMLSMALTNFSNLRHVRIRCAWSYQHHCERPRDWKLLWGANTMLEDIGIGREHCRTSEKVLEDFKFETKHFAIVLEALESIVDRTEWTLSLETPNTCKPGLFNSFLLDWPLDPDYMPWMNCKDRLIDMAMCRTTSSSTTSIGPDHSVKLLEDAPIITQISIIQEENVAGIFKAVERAHLRTIVLERSQVRQSDLKLFLSNHSGVLQNITFRHVNLVGAYGDLSMGILRSHTSWLSVFKLLEELSHVTQLTLSFLEQNGIEIDRYADHPWEWWSRGAGRTLYASGNDVKEVLADALDYKIAPDSRTLNRGHARIWFFGQASHLVVSRPKSFVGRISADEYLGVHVRY